MSSYAADALREGERIGLDFADFFREEYARLLRALLLLTGSAAEAEDLAQEAMARAFERWERVREMESPVGYLYRTAMNLNRKRLRRLATQSRKLLGGLEETDHLLAAEDRAEIKLLVESLSRDQREALLLVEWIGFTSEEAGDVLGIKPESVRSRLHRARATLKERFGGIDE